MADQIRWLKSQISVTSTQVSQSFYFQTSSCGCQKGLLRLHHSCLPSSAQSDFFFFSIGDAHKAIINKPSVLIYISKSASLQMNWTCHTASWEFYLWGPSKLIYVKHWNTANYKRRLLGENNIHIKS